MSARDLTGLSRVSQSCRSVAEKNELSLRVSVKSHSWRSKKGLVRVRSRHVNSLFCCELLSFVQVQRSHHLIAAAAQGCMSVDPSAHESFVNEIS
jgi:hypothetical protein